MSRVHIRRGMHIPPNYRPPKPRRWAKVLFGASLTFGVAAATLFVGGF